MHLFWTLIIGGVAGWLAGRIMKSTGRGVIMNIILGLVGSLVGGMAFGLLGLKSSNLIGMFVTATAGAVILIVLARAIR